MKVLFLQHGLGYGGATKSLMLIQKALQNEVEIHTIIKKGRKKLNPEILKEFIYSKEISEIEIQTVYSYSEATIPFHDFKKNITYYPKQLIDYINHKNIDILHVNSSIFSNILKHIKEATNCKIVVHIREMLPFGLVNPIDKYIIENTCSYSDSIICISDNESRRFGLSEKLFVVPNPHDFEESDRYLKLSKNNSEKIIIGMCSNFNPIKGHLIFLEAANLINIQSSELSNNIEFVIIGYPKNVNSLKEFGKRILNYGYKYQFDKKIKECKIKNLSIIPFTYNIYKELADFDIYVRPDLSGNPWGRDIIEAMAFKLPIVATGESEFYLKNMKTGFLVPPNNPTKMAEKIKILIENKNLREKMGIQAYDLIKNRSNLDSYKKTIMNIYSLILS